MLTQPHPCPACFLRKYMFFLEKASIIVGYNHCRLQSYGHLSFHNFHLMTFQNSIMCHTRQIKNKSTQFAQSYYLSLWGINSCNMAQCKQKKNNHENNCVINLLSITFAIINTTWFHTAARGKINSWNHVLTSSNQIVSHSKSLF